MPSNVGQIEMQRKARCTDVLDSVSLCEISYRQFERTDALDHGFFWSWHDVYSIYRTERGARPFRRNGRWSKIARHSSSINRLSFESVLLRNARLKCCSMWKSDSSNFRRVLRAMLLFPWFVSCCRSDHCCYVNLCLLVSGQMRLM